MGLEHAKPDDKIQELQSQLEAERENNKKINAELIRKENQVIYLSNANGNLTQMLNQAFTDRDKAVRDRDEIENSEFWKITLPLRKLMDKIKRIKAPREQKHYTLVDNCRSLRDIQACFQRNNVGKKIYCDTQLAEKNAGNGKKILLVSHELDLTGAPIALSYFAKALKNRGDFPVVIAPREGKLTEQIIADGIPVLIDSSLLSNDSLIAAYAEPFDAVIVNTLASVAVVKKLGNSTIPVMWWIHEADTSYTSTGCFHAPQMLPENVKVYTVGSYAYQCLKKHRPMYSADNLLYCIPDEADQQNDIQHLDIPEFEEKTKGKTVFCIVGMQERRKGQDILLDAIAELTEEERKKSYFIFAGRQFYPPIHRRLVETCEAYPDCILDAGELNREEVNAIYSTIDCLICASRDDPMPIVATEAMMHSKAVICSEYTGTAQIVQNENCGQVYHNNDKHELAEKIRYMLANPEEMHKYGENGRAAYLAYFSQEAFQRNVSDCLDQVLQGKTKATANEDIKVSVVIPTYNAGLQFSLMLDKLNHQKLAGLLEVVVVDSGSTDGTIEIAEKYGTKLVKIRHEKFSHSYARNYGVEKSDGNIILFMTQDALPIGEDWVAKLIEPIAEKKAVAVSVKEQCPESTELFYKVSSRVFYHYLGVGNEIKFNAIKEGEHLSPEQLRKRAQLSDVTCAIDRSTFELYHYRYEFAEDLDMGVRLLKDGYTIALNGEINVLHGHTRSYGYYLKRSLVDALSIGKIIPGLEFGYDSVHNVALRIYSAAEATHTIINKCASRRESRQCIEHVNDLIQLMQKQASSPIEFNGDFSGKFHDELIDSVVCKCGEYCATDYIGDYGLLHGLIGYLENDMIPYLQENKQVSLSEKEMLQQIDNCIIKQMAVFFGAELAKIRWSSVLYEKFDDLMKGV